MDAHRIHRRMSSQAHQRRILAVLRRLVANGTCLVRDARGDFRHERNGRRLDKCDRLVAAELLQRGLIAPQLPASAHRFVLAESGSAMVRRFLSGAEEFAEQHQLREATNRLDARSEPIRVVVNRDESPLSWLRHRRGPGGRPWIGEPEFAAGERLRTDFTRAQLMPRVTANWTSAVASGRRSGGVDAELSEVALDARRRVEKALDAVGPELAGVLTDACCFLKGLEEVERERRWPPRSAKVVLRLALDALARHYGLSTAARGRPTGLKHWGSEDYRPSID